MSGTPSFTIDDVVATQRQLRKRLGLGDEQFPLQAFVGMLSDEIERLRAAGHSDAEIVATVEHATGKPLSVDDLQKFYASPEKRRR
jgi:hypothetical protein